jgi:hypothetical protein
LRLRWHFLEKGKKNATPESGGRIIWSSIGVYNQQQILNLGENLNDYLP